MGKATLQEVKHKVEYEGIGYCLTDYYSAKNIENPELAALWQTAADTIAKIEKMLDAVEFEDE